MTGGTSGNLGASWVRRALDAACDEIASVAANECAAREDGFWQTQEASSCDGSCAIGNSFSCFDALGLIAFKIPFDIGVRFKALKFFKGTQPRVLIVKADDETHGHLVVGQMVQKGAAIGVVFKWPARAVKRKPSLVAGRVNFPKLFDADAVTLRVTVLVKFEVSNQLFA